MVIEEVHGLHATSMSLSDRFTMLSAAAPQRFVPRPRRRPSVNSYFNQNTNNNNSNFAQQMARRLEMEVKRQAMKQRLGALRRFGSESSLPGMRRSNSWGNLSQASVKQRGQWRQSNGNLSRAVSFENVSQAWRNFRRRGGGARALRGRFRGRGRGARGMRGVRGRRGGAGARGGQRGQRAPQQAPRGRPGRGLRARGRGRGRGGILRNQPPKPVPTKEELDDQLDRYMAGTKTALDKEIDEYMKNAMEFE